MPRTVHFAPTRLDPSAQSVMLRNNGRSLDDGPLAHQGGVSPPEHLTNTSHGLNGAGGPTQFRSGMTRKAMTVR